MELSEEDYKTIQDASDITCTNYEGLVDKYIKPEDMLYIIQDLLVEIGKLKEDIEDLEEDIQENYTHKRPEPDWHDIQDNRPSWWN